MRTLGLPRGKPRNARCRGRAANPQIGGYLKSSITACRGFRRANPGDNQSLIIQIERFLRAADRTLALFQCLLVGGGGSKLSHVCKSVVAASGNGKRKNNDRNQHTSKKTIGAGSPAISGLGPQSQLRPFRRACAWTSVRLDACAAYPMVARS